MSMGFDAQWLQITGILVLTQELSSGNKKLLSRARQAEEFMGLTLLLNDSNWLQLFYLHASLLICAKHFRSFGYKETVVTPYPQKHLQRDALSHQHPTVKGSEAGFTHLLNVERFTEGLSKIFPLSSDCLYTPLQRE